MFLQVRATFGEATHGAELLAVAGSARSAHAKNGLTLRLSRVDAGARAAVQKGNT